MTTTTGSSNNGTGSNNKNVPSQWPLLAQMISKDLGMDEKTTLKHLKEHTVYLYVNHNNSSSSSSNTHNNRIVGVVTVQIISQAYRMINLHERSRTPTGAVLGVGILWTHPAARHGGIATRLVTAARGHTVFGVAGRIATSLLAFSSPTQAGYDFAIKYCSSSSSSTNDNALQQQQQQQQQEEEKEKEQLGPLVYEM
jgi:hypothetical protein